jgi:hypothetical protein
MMRQTEGKAKGRGSLAGFPRQSEYVDWLLAVGLFCLGVASRIPFRSRLLHHWDSVQFALGTSDFDIALHQPHPPGYIVYVYLGKALNLLTQDPQSSFVRLSIMFSGLAAAATFCLGKSMFGRLSGFVAALFLLTNPLFWFYGEVALPHVLEVCFAALIALLLYKGRGQSEKRIVVSALLLGIAAGIRQLTPVLLLPLFAFGLGKAKTRSVVLAIVCLTIVSLLWFLPTVWLAGGWAEYMGIIRVHSEEFIRPTSVFLGGGFRALANNAIKLVGSAFYSLGLVVVPVLVCPISEWTDLPIAHKSKRIRFLLCWMIPPILFYLLVHMGQQGQVLILLPPLSLLCAESVVRALRSEQHRARSLICLLVAALIPVLGSGLFLFAPEYLIDGRLAILNRRTIQNVDVRTADKVRLVRDHFRPEETIVFATAFRHASYYLPEYRVFWIPAITADMDIDSITVHTSYQHRYQVIEQWSPALVSQNTRILVLFDEDLAKSVRSPRTQVQVLPGQDGDIHYLELLPDQQILCGYQHFEVRD